MVYVFVKFEFFRILSLINTGKGFESASKIAFEHLGPRESQGF